MPGSHASRGRSDIDGRPRLAGRARSSAGERRLCKAEALGSNPSGSIRCTTPSQARVGRVDAWSGRTDRVDDAACTCDPDAHWTHSPQTWLLCHLVDGSAREPTTDVPSGDTPGRAARKRRTRDLRMGIPSAIASRNGERRELKHLSIGRKRNQTRCR
jgi:hypothetical protein